MSWLKKYLLPILLTVFSLLLITNIIIHYWNGWSITTGGSTLFNNLVTPIATIISIVIYYVTLRVLIKQNRINQSNNLKPDYQRKFDFVMDKLKEKHIKYGNFTEKFNCFDILDRLYEDVSGVVRNRGYSEHLKEFKAKGELKIESNSNVKFLYVDDTLNHIYPFCNYGISRYDRAVDLIEKIKESGMLADDIIRFKEQIRMEMIDPYMQFIKKITSIKGQYPIPLFNERDNNNIIPWKPFGETKISKHYNYFLIELYPEQLK